MSFGNQGSTVRLFRRVSDNSTTAQVSSDDGSPESILKEEKRPPMVETTTKEAILGRRAFNKVVDPAFQELYAQTGNQSKQDALSRVANAWSVLDAVDPEGQYQLLKLLIDKAHKDPKLASLLPAAKSQPASPQASPQKSPAKLVLAQNNPHLKSHRRRQSSMLEMREKLQKLPGEAVPGMEHTKQLADVLYGRWADGLRNRWGAAS
jgi:serine/threonine-protein kinase 24/25/MST4